MNTTSEYLSKRNLESFIEEAQNLGPYSFPGLSIVAQAMSNEDTCNCDGLIMCRNHRVSEAINNASELLLYAVCGDR